MKSFSSIIIIVLIFIVSILTILLLFFLSRILKTKKRKALIENLSLKIKESRLKKSDIVLSRIRKISDTNKKFNELYKRLSAIWEKMAKKTKEINKKVSYLLLKYKKMSNKKFILVVNEIKNEINSLNDTEITFNTVALKLTRQDDFTRSEKSFYDSNLRKAIEVYKDKRILLDKISLQIDKMIKEIAEIDRIFDAKLVSADTLAINKVLVEYSNKVIRFCEIINKGPSLQNYIYNIIPKISQNIYNLYNQKKNELKTSLKHINFVKSIEKTSSIHNSAKSHFDHLNFEKAEIEIKMAIKSIKIIEKMINAEVKARNLFVNQYSQILKEVSMLLTEFINIKSQIKTIKTKNISFPYEFKNKFLSLIELSKIIDSEAMNFKSILNNSNIPYTSKMTRMKLLSQKLYDFSKKINEINQYIFDLDINRSILKNKFKRVENAFNNLVANIKDKNIKIPSEYLKNINEINSKISHLNKIILKVNISNSEVDYIESAISNIIRTYKMLAGTVEISDIIRNLIKKLSIERAINDNLNYQLSIAEKEYLEGKYASSLNALIQHLEGG